MKHFEVELYRFDSSTFRIYTERQWFWTIRSALRWIRRNPQHDPVRINHVHKDPANPFRLLRTDMFVLGPDGVWQTPRKDNRSLHRLDLKTGKVTYWKASSDA
jgi:hypothetical protein